MEFQQPQSKSQRRREVAAALVAVLFLAGCGGSEQQHRMSWFQSRVLGNTAYADAQYRAAQKHFQAAYQEARQMKGDSTREYISLSDLAAAWSEDGSYAEAQPYIARTLELYKAGDGNDSFTYLRDLEMIRSLLGFGVVCEREKRSQQAQELYTKAVTMAQRVANEPPIGPGNRVAGYYWTLGLCRLLEAHIEAKNFTAARNEYNQAIQSGLRAVLPLPLTPRLQKILRQLSTASATITQVQTISPDKVQATHWLTFMESGRAKMATEKEQAVVEFEKAVAAARALGPTDARLCKTQFLLGRTELELDRYDAAERNLKEALAINEVNKDPVVGESILFFLAECMRKRDRPAEALPYARRRVQILESSEREDADVYLGEAWLGQQLVETGNYAEADKVLSKAVDSLGNTALAKSWKRGVALSYLGEARAKQGLHAEAKQSLEKALAMLLADPGSPAYRLDEVRQMLSQQGGALNK